MGQFILNMGGIELITRVIIAHIHGTDQVEVFSADLAKRIGYLRKRFPRVDPVAHKKAMTTLGVAEKHAAFRNIIAHGTVILASSPNGTPRALGIVNVTPKDRSNLFTIVSLEELRGRVNESAAVLKELLEMQAAFRTPNSD